MSFRIVYELTGVGWARCDLSYEASCASIRASYLSDALGKLLRGVLALVDGMHAVEFGFDDEPGDFRWRIEYVSPERCLLAVRHFADRWVGLPFEAGRTVFQAEVDLDDILLAVAVAAAEVLRKHGLGGYHNRWVNYPFPSAELRRLDVMLAPEGG